jgi:carboxyl-terminal processing protease
MRLRTVALALALVSSLAACAPSRGTIGAMLAQKPDGRLVVREVPKGLAADQAGLEPGDEILLVDGVDVRRYDEKALHEKLSGEIGSTVKLTVLRGEEIRHVVLRRTPAGRRARPVPTGGK